jgi:hypothetical protein
MVAQVLRALLSPQERVKSAATVQWLAWTRTHQPDLGPETARMRAEQVTVHQDGHVTVTFNTFPIELPEPLDGLVLAQLARRGQASYASHPDH